MIKNNLINWLAIILGVIIIFVALISMLIGNELPKAKVEIRSETPIQPRIELIIKDNKVDTIYIYSL